ncbi:hypothetical protein RHOFW104T7_18020 [Rhodanobacter thiooxydans]|uniref:Uncharacterized protein n=1 Tax=Rhodanobacter thiooxydans TaxID=416169 RepID=A0A154QEI1_9GAMM|nr:hypothetical protein UUA_09596 [Rhodanobacter thiooxydans LCS2]KZC22701.1 hypothetical protein RHOFW104T7_18020 [Rhodanobacter thiooxydans]
MSRNSEHLIERIEDESQKDINPGLYPRMALLPGERIEVKSGQVVVLDASARSGVRAQRDAPVDEAMP